MTTQRDNKESGYVKKREMPQHQQRNNSAQRSTENRKCFNCGKTGHIARNCRDGKKGAPERKRHATNTNHKQQQSSNDLQLQCDGPFPMGLRSTMADALKKVRGVTKATIIAHKTMKKMEVAKVHPTEPFIIYSKIDDGKCTVHEVATRAAMLSARDDMLYKAMAADSNAAVKSAVMTQLNNFISGTEISKEWPGDNRERLKKELSSWLDNIIEKEAAAQRAETANIDRDVVRWMDKEKQRISELRKKVEKEVEKMKDAAKKNAEKNDSDAKKASARATLERAASQPQASGQQQPSLAATEAARVLAEQRAHIEALKREVTALAQERESNLSWKRSAEREFLEVQTERDNLRAHFQSLNPAK
jgi:hypothetical protein